MQGAETGPGSAPHNVSACCLTQRVGHAVSEVATARVAKITLNRLRNQERLCQTGGRRPVMKKIRATINPITKRIQAMLVAAPATPDKPSAPAMIATIKNINAQESMVFSFGSN